MAINDSRKVVMAEEVRVNFISAFNDERVCPPSSDALGSKMNPSIQLPPSLSQGIINSTKRTSSAAPYEVALDDDDSDLNISSPDSSPVANSVNAPDEVLCEQSLEADLKILFAEEFGKEESILIPSFFKEASINLIPISDS